MFNIQSIPKFHFVILTESCRWSGKSQLKVWHIRLRWVHRHPKLGCDKDLLSLHCDHKQTWYDIYIGRLLAYFPNQYAFRYPYSPQLEQCLQTFKCNDVFVFDDGTRNGESTATNKVQRHLQVQHRIRSRVLESQVACCNWNHLSSKSLITYKTRMLLWQWICKPQN